MDASRPPWHKDDRYEILQNHSLTGYGGCTTKRFFLSLGVLKEEAPASRIAAPSDTSTGRPTGDKPKGFGPENRRRTADRVKLVPDRCGLEREAQSTETELTGGRRVYSQG